MICNIQVTDLNTNSTYFNSRSPQKVLKTIDDMKFEKGGVDSFNTTTIYIVDENIFNLCLEKSMWPDV